MGIKARITDGAGTDLEAKVDESRALYTIQVPAPPFSDTAVMRPFRQYLTDDGTATGSNDMAVDGSSTTQSFYVQADQNNDRYIATLSFVIADASQVLNEFANTNAALTNGCRLFYMDTEGDVEIHDALKTNFDFVRLGLGTPSFGDGAGAFRASNVSGSSEGYIPTLDLRRTFGFQWGIKIPAGTNFRLQMDIRDDCTAADLFDCIAYGFDLSPTKIT